jgi:protein-S-isoprenylcysteine O-methyltransferase Ste14
MQPTILARLPPPLLYVAALLIAHYLDVLSHVGRLPRPWLLGARWLGLALLGIGVVHAASAVSLFVTSRTTIVPHHRSSELVTRGAYRWTRNPMYVGLTFAYLGVAAVLGSAWALPLLAIPLYVVHKHVIPMEERQLEEVFGDSYRQYKTRVRRWL